MRNGKPIWCGNSYELVRHRLSSYSQESSRYCNFTKDKFTNQVTFIQPSWISDEQLELVKKLNEKNFTEINEDVKIWYYAMSEAEQSYNRLIKLGWSPGQARSILPHSLKTEIVMTANLREWRTVIGRI